MSTPLEEFSSPTISVVVPAFNASRFLGDTLRSIVGQAGVRVECIVVDDGSTDSTADVARSFSGVIVVQTPNRGVAAARNLGVETATKPWVAFCDADDVWHPDKLALQYASLVKSPGAGGVVCGYRFLNGDVATGDFVPPDLDTLFRKWLTLEGAGPGLASTLMVRAEVLAQVGGFDSRFSLRKISILLCGCKSSAS